jgi:hypothetical protein
MRRSNFKSATPNLRSAIAKLLVAALVAGSAGCSTLGGAAAPATQPEPASGPQAASDEQSAHTDAWKQISDVLGKRGELKAGVYTVTFPRDDLNVRIDGMDVPTAAGIESTFRFYICSCGKTVVIGQFVCADYEANDVAYALQKENLLISSMGPYLLYDKPHLMAVRFQAEGKPQPLALAIKSAIDWTGKNRIPPPQKIEP